MKKIYLATALLISTMLLSCEKYVEDFVTKGSLIATGTDSYRNLLNNTRYFEETASLPDFSSDDIHFADGKEKKSLNDISTYAKIVKAYTWGDQYYPLGTSDRDWDRFYNLISYANTVIYELPSIQGDAKTKTELTAEALVHRADAYLQLVNLYAKTYNAATASTDPGVPLITRITYDQNLVRSTVQEIYDQVFKDLTEALPSLPSKSTYNTLPSQVAVYALLARASLLSGQYTRAKDYADQALNIQNTLVNYNDYIINRYPAKNVDPEIILSKIASESFSSGSFVSMRLNDELINLWGVKDLRYQVLTRPSSNFDPQYTGRGYFKEIISGYRRNNGPCVPEMMLISAEGMARSGNAVGAINMINQLRSKRFAPADYLPLTAASSDEALKIVLDERRRELFCHGSRWFDQKRLNADQRFAKTYTRSFLGVNYTLEPNGKRFVYPIANYYFQYNPFLVQNPR